MFFIQIFLRLGTSDDSSNKKSLMKDFQAIDEYFPFLARGYPHSTCKVLFLITIIKLYVSRSTVYFYLNNNYILGILRCQRSLLGLFQFRKNKQNGWNCRIRRRNNQEQDK